MGLVMNLDDKAIKIITSLVRKTSDGEVKWSVGIPPQTLTSATEDEIHAYFEAPYKDRKFALYERKSKYFYDEHAFYWISSQIFAILDNNKNVILEYSKQTPVLDDLFLTVRGQIADLDSLLDDLLK